MRVFQIKYQGESLYIPAAEPNEVSVTKGFFLEAQSTKKLLAFTSVNGAASFFRVHNLKEHIDATVHIDVENILKWVRAVTNNVPPSSELNNLYCLMLDYYGAAYSGENESIPDSLDYPQLRGLNSELFEQERYETVMRDCPDKHELFDKWGIRAADQAKLRDIRNSAALKAEVEQLVAKFLGILKVQRLD